MSIKLDSKMLSTMNVFSSATGVMPRDSLEFSNRLVFVVSQGQAGLAIGRNGANIKLLTKMLSRDLLVVEYSDQPIKLLENIIQPSKVVSGYMAEGADGSQKLEAVVQPRISREKMELTKVLMQRYFNIKEINIR